MRARAAVADGAQVPPEDAQERARALPARGLHLRRHGAEDRRHARQVPPHEGGLRRLRQGVLQPGEEEHLDQKEGCMSSDLIKSSYLPLKFQFTIFS